MSNASISDNTASKSAGDQRVFLFLRAMGVLLATILSISTWLLMSMSLGSKKHLDDFGQTPSMAMSVLHRAGVWPFILVIVALLASAGCFLNPKWTFRTLILGACLIASAAVVLAAVMVTILFEFSKLIADLS
jgi:hypothetical protein